MGTGGILEVALTKRISQVFLNLKSFYFSLNSSEQYSLLIAAESVFALFAFVILWYACSHIVRKL